MENLSLVLSFFNQYNFSLAKANIANIEYYFQCNPGTNGNQLIEELIKAIKTYDFDAIGQPLFQSIMAKCRKNEQECQQIMTELVQWKKASKEQMQPAVKYLQDICAAAVVQKANRLYQDSPSEYLKYLKTVNFQSGDLETFSSIDFDKVDINSLVAENADDYYPSRYDWINKCFDPYPGYPRGQLIIVQGKPGSGKSLWMMSEALNFASRGIKTFYIALGDLKLKDFVVRMGANFSGMSFANTTRNLGAVYDALKKTIKDNLAISINPAGKVSGQDIVDWVKAKPEYKVIFLDYDSNASGIGGDESSMYSAFGNLYEKLNEISLVENRLLFVGAQPKIGSWPNPVLEMTDVGESSRKQHSADVIIGIGTEQQCPNHLHTLKISKNRRGETDVKDYEIRLESGRWISLPKGLFDQLKQEKEKRLYTESEIEQMKEAYLLQYNRIQNGVSNSISQQSQQPGNSNNHLKSPFGN